MNTHRYFSWKLICHGRDLLAYLYSSCGLAAIAEGNSSETALMEKCDAENAQRQQKSRQQRAIPQKKQKDRQERGRQ